jgi:predicted HAD superfamily Cof-like phosphohydrolase
MFKESKGGFKRIPYRPASGPVPERGLRMLKNWQQLQKDFLEACNTETTTPAKLGLSMRHTDRIRIVQALSLCHNLIDEETNKELLRTLHNVLIRNEAIQHTGPTYVMSFEEMETLVDDMVDTVYVVCQLANTMGIDLDACYREVHRANMAKVSNGKVIRREDGKILKPTGWVGPQLGYILEKQISESNPNDLVWQVAVTAATMRLKELCKLDTQLAMDLKDNNKTQVVKALEEAANTLIVLIKEINTATTKEPDHVHLNTEGNNRDNDRGATKESTG